MKDKVLHICHITTVHPPDDVRIFHKECKSLSKAGFVVSLIAPHPIEKIAFDDVHFYGFEKAKSRLKRFLNTGKQVYRIAQIVNADVYHFHDPDFLWFAYKLYRKGKKVVYDVHEDVPRQILGKYWIPGYLRKMVSIMFESFENQFSSKFNAIVTATPYIKSRFEKINKRVVDINNFPLLEEFPLHVEPDYNGKSVCYAGGLEKVRGAITMVEAIGMTHLTLELAGKFSSLSVQHEAEKTKGWNQVVFHGFLNRTEVGKFYANSFAGLVVLHPLPNYIEAIPVKMLEYMAAGLPVIASDFQYWRTLIEEYNCSVFVNPERPEEIAAAMMELHSNPQKCEEMGKRSRKAAIEKFNWETEAEKLINLYQNICSNFE